MKLPLRFLLEVALFAYPADFRERFREQILSDVEESRAHSLAAALDIAGNGLRMRIGLLANDLVYAAQRLLRLPLFVGVVVITFALGIGANVAVFTVLNAVLLKPLPYHDPGRLVVFRYVNTKTAALGADLSVPELGDFGRQRAYLAEVGGVVRDQATLTGAEKPVAINGLDVTPPVFAALGIAPELGRFFAEADEARGAHSVVISDPLWRSYFGAAQNVVGKAAVLDGTTYQIVGVTPPGFRVPLPDSGLLNAPDFIEVQPDAAPPSTRGAQYIGTIARLPSGVTVAAANAALQLTSRRLQRSYPVETGLIYYVRPLDDVVFGDFKAALWTVLGAAIGILIITCANVSNMLLSTASSREREFVLRSALGASSRRLGAQLLTEAGLLATVGGIAGVALAYASLAILRPALAAFPRSQTIALDGWALAYAMAVIVAATILAGFWPMRAIARPDLSVALKAAGRTTDSATNNAARSALVVVEVSLALALVALSGLMLRSYFLMTRSDIGVRQEGLWVSSQVNLPAFRYPTLSDRAAFQQRLSTQLRGLPGVDSAALGLNYPLSNIHFFFDLDIVGRHFAPGSNPIALLNVISPNYFDTMGIPLLRGRVFSTDDSAQSLPVALVNETFERLYALHGNAIGMQLISAGVNKTGRATRTVVGVVRDARDTLTRETRPVYYVPVAQTPIDFFSVMLRSNLSGGTLTAELARAMETTDPQMAAPALQSYGDLVAAATAHARSVGSLLGALACIAMLLALSGIFGVVSYSVTQRYREFGVRIALGAAARHIVLDVLGRSLAITGVGIAIGLVIAAIGGRAVASQLYFLSPFDPITFMLVVALLLASAVAAAAIPAIRATRIDPAVALRCE
ncbi:MAG: ABC transporter permease [Candidatus Cybelea sp.]